MKTEKIVYHHVKESPTDAHRILQEAIEKMDTSGPSGLYAEYEKKKDDYLFSHRFNYIDAKDSPICIYRYIIMKIEQNEEGSNLVASYIYNKELYLQIIGGTIAAMVIAVLGALLIIVKWGYASYVITALAAVMVFLGYMIKHASPKNDLAPEKVIELYSNFIRKHLTVTKKGK